MELLRRVPEAHLVLYAPPGSHRERVRETREKAELATDRLTFVPRQSFEDYLRTYGDIDVALDPFPYGGGTTTCDALWMGVPVVTLAGRTAVSRAGSSLLSNTGLGHLVAQSEAAYLDTAESLLSDTDTLAVLRRELRDRMRSSPIMDAVKFTHDFESALRDMWRSWCSYRAPQRQGA
jgi:protein O-GlcNAc transferase